ncbi:hypothetical protein AB0I28_04680 [Phytomonospora sp. NPDC050363]|uniref:hypothetical protein n=1 Tax=Phytomonospora sp. NPDC050363 TaxID=3155642 RepID=UPI0033D383FD
MIETIRVSSPKLGVAFGRPDFPSGGSLAMDPKIDSRDLHHLLQLGEDHEWEIGGEGGVMHWSIPTAALRAGDFTRAIPTPDMF